MSNQSSDIGAFMAGFIIGGLVGAATALLLAPQSGEETRTIIRDKSIELKDKATETAEETRHRAEKALEEARHRAEIAVEEARMRAEELAKITKERTSEIQHRGQVVLEEQKSKIESAVEKGRKKLKSADEETADAMEKDGNEAPKSAKA